MKLYHLILLAGMLVLFSCRGDFLNKYPLDAPSNENFFSNKKELDLALNGAYTGLWWEGNGVPFYLWLDGTTDICWIRGDYNDMQTIQSGNYTPETDVFIETWSHMYQSIAKCNNILQNMHRAKDKVDSAYYIQVEAQAKFLRSFYYFYLVELFGNVPWVPKMLSLDSAQLPQTPRKEIVQNIYADLDFAAKNLPESWNGDNKGKATKGAALTLKARLALNEGDYETASEAANAVIEEQLYSIDPNYEQLFKLAGEESNEIIFTLPYLKSVKVSRIPQYEGPRNAPGYAVLVPRQRMIDLYQCIDGKSIDVSAKYDPSHPFENRDPRLDQSIIRPGVWFNNYLFQTHPDSTTTLKVEGGDTIRVGNSSVTNAYATFTGYLWNKYLDPAEFPDVTNSELHVILMRYAEVLLTYAEAKIGLNQIDQSVIDAINKVRHRPSVEMPKVSLGMSQDELRKIVRYERTVEFADEGFRLFDIRRWKYAEHVLPGKVYGRRDKDHWYEAVVPSIDKWQNVVYPNGDELFKILNTNMFNPDRDYLWPIPQKAMDINHHLKQNPGY